MSASPLAEARRRIAPRPRPDRIISHRLEPEELQRLEPMIRARPIVLAAWSYCLGRIPAAQALQRVTTGRSLADVAAARALEVLR